MDRSTVEEKAIFGRRLIVAAWTFQIAVTFILLFVAYTIMNDSISAHSNNLTPEQFADIFLGSLPFLIISLIELLKVLWVKLLFVSKRAIIKVVVSIVLLVSIFITIETVLYGFERQFSNITSAIQEPINKLQQINRSIVLIERGETLADNQSLSELKTEKERLKDEVNRDESLSQLYRFTKYRMGIDSIADLTLNDVITTARWWYGTLAILVSIMGVILAFGGYMLQRANKE
jgi:magnesium-transporting ATPase (P-type)